MRKHLFSLGLSCLLFSFAGTKSAASDWKPPANMPSAQLGKFHQQLMTAASTGKTQEVKKILGRHHPINININFKDPEGNTALHHAASRGSKPMIRELMGVSPCADWKVKNNRGQTPVDVAKSEELKKVILSLAQKCSKASGK